MALAEQESNSCDNFVDCKLQSIPIEDLKKSLYIKHKTTGCVYLNMEFATGDCEDYEPAATCGSNESSDDLYRKSIGLDACGRPVQRVFSHSELT